MEDKSIIIIFTAKKMLPLALVYGIYILLNGHLTPGGGFQSGVIIAAAFIIYTLAMDINRARELLSQDILVAGFCIGASLFAIMGLLGIFLGYNYLSNKVAGLLPSTLKILIIEIGIALTVACAIITIVLSFIENIPDKEIVEEIKRREKLSRRRWSDV